MGTIFQKHLMNLSVQNAGFNVAKRMCMVWEMFGMKIPTLIIAQAVVRRWTEVKSDGTYCI